MLTSEAARAAVRKEAAVRRALGEQRATTTVQQDSAVQRIVRCRIVRCAEGSWRIVRWRVVWWRMVRRIVRWRT